MSIDVEGLDLSVLQSIDWNSFRREVILVENLTRNLKSIYVEGMIRKFLRPKGYKILAKTVNTVFFKLNK